MVDGIRKEVGKVLVGQKDLVDFMIAAILADGHVLLEGVPGIAKTLTARLFARVLNTQFTRIQFTPDLMPADIVGTAVFNPKTTHFEFKAGPVFSNIVLIDEVNRAPAKTQAALFEVMEERQVSIDGVTYPMKQPFLVFATQNPIEHEGTYRLPEAQLDRFLFKLDVGYPSLEEEVEILVGYHQGRSSTDLDIVKPVITEEHLILSQQVVHKVHVEPNLLQYVARLVQETRNHEKLYLGASPRGSLAMLKGAQALAAMDGRDFVVPADIQKAALPVLRHRVMLTSDQEMEGATPDRVIKQLVDRLDVPR